MITHMNSSNVLKGSFISLVGIISLTFMASFAFADTVTVTEGSLQGWAESSASGGSAQIVLDSSHSGLGALELITTSDVNSVTHYTLSENIALSDISQLSYDTKVVSAADATNGNATMRINISYVATSTGDTVTDQLMFEPYYNGFSGSTDWNTWTITSTTGKLWSNNNLTYNGLGGVSAGSYASNFTLADVLHDYPDAQVTGVVISMGTWNVSQDVLADNVNVTTSTDSTTYNFEPDTSSLISNDQGQYFATLQDAIDGTAAGTVTLGSDITTTEQVTIDHAITIEGNGKTLSPNFTQSGDAGTNNAAIGIIGAPATVTIKDLTIDGTNGTSLHGINVYESAGVFLQSVTIKNNDQAALNVNGSSVSAESLNTSGNGWGSVDVDPGSGVTMPSIFNLDSASSLGDVTQIWSDGGHVSGGSPTVTVNADGYDKYLVGGTDDSYVWSNSTPKGATIQGDPANTLYSTIQSAIDASADGDQINVGAGTYAENVTTLKSLTIIGAGADVTSIVPTSGHYAFQIPTDADHPFSGHLTLQGFTLGSPTGYGFSANSGTPNNSYYNSDINLKDIVIDGAKIGIVFNSTNGATLDNVAVKNVADFNGLGALELTGVANLEVTNSSFTDNAKAIRIQSTSTSTDPGFGYGANGPITITDTTFVGNTQDIDDQSADTQFSLSGNQYGHVDVTGTTTTETTSSGDITMEIQPRTVVTGPEGWDGIVNPPTETTSFTLTPDSGFTADAVVAIEVGSPDTALTFDTPVKLTFAGQADKLVGWSRNGTFQPITATCDSSTNPTLGEGADCKVSSDGSGNLVVWTKHFTAFVVYTQTAIPTSSGSSGGSSGGGGNGPIVGGGGGGGGSTAVALPNNGGAAPTTGTTNTGSTGTGSTGQVLGAATYNFAVDLTIGSRGADVVELQKELIAMGFSIPALTSGSATYGYFGTQTRSAVAAYQKAHSITPAVGYFGPITRASFNAGTTPTMTDEQRSLLLVQLTQQLATLQARLNELKAASSTAQ
jgi:hypothetical protein